MPDRDVAFIRDLIYCQNAKIIAESAFAGSDGESRLKHRGDTRSCITPIPPLLPSTAPATAQARPTGTTGTT